MNSPRSQLLAEIDEYLSVLLDGSLDDLTADDAVRLVARLRVLRWQLTTVQARAIVRAHWRDPGSGAG